MRPGRLHGGHRALRYALNLLHAGSNLAGLLASLLGELAYFVGHHRETPALLTGPSRFDGGIQRQQIGLIGNAANHLTDPVNRQDCLRQFVHRRAGAIDRFNHVGCRREAITHAAGSPTEQGTRRVNRLGRLLRAVGNFVDRGHQLLNGSRNTRYRLGLTVHRPLGLEHLGAHRIGMVVHQVCRFGDLGHHGFEMRLHGDQGIVQAPQFIIAAQRNVVRQIPLGDPLNPSDLTIEHRQNFAHDNKKTNGRHHAKTAEHSQNHVGGLFADAQGRCQRMQAKRHELSKQQKAEHPTKLGLERQTLPPGGLRYGRCTCLELGVKRLSFGNLLP